MLEYLLLIVSIFGVIPFRSSIMEVFSFLRKFGFEERFHSSNFPDLNAMILIVIYGTCLFLLVRHSKKNFLTIVVPLVGLAIINGSSNYKYCIDQAILLVVMCTAVFGYFLTSCCLKCLVLCWKSIKLSEIEGMRGVENTYSGGRG